MTTGSRISVPLLEAVDVVPHLGRPTHWKQGRSAKALADSWFNAGGLPKAIKVLFASNALFYKAELVDGWLERKTDLRDGCGAPSQTDLLALLSLTDKNAILAIEAKVDEGFGPLVSEWLADGSIRKHKRLAALCERLGLLPESAKDLRYQLLHRAVAALIEADRFRTDTAILAVQSFCPKKSGYDDFAKFGHALGFEPLTSSQLSGPLQLGGISFWMGWTPDDIWQDFFAKPGSPDFVDTNEKYDADGRPIAGT